MQNGKILSKKMLNDHIVELKIQTSKIELQPWARVFIHYPTNEGTIKRAYSVTNLETEGEVSILTFLIKLVENGKGSEILKKLPEASELQIEEGKGHFLLKNTTNPKVFLSTGSGLAPCYRMAKEDKSWSQKRFFFSVSYAKDLFYVEEIKNLNIPETHISISREEVEGFEYGRINIDHIDFPAETEFYICWVPLMVKEFLTNLRARGYKNIFVEAY